MEVSARDELRLTKTNHLQGAGQRGFASLLKSAVLPRRCMADYIKELRARIGHMRS